MLRNRLLVATLLFRQNSRNLSFAFNRSAAKAGAAPAAAAATADHPKAEVDKKKHSEAKQIVYENNWGKGLVTDLNKLVKVWEKNNQVYYGPQRDMVNYPPPRILDSSPPTRIGFIPERWFTALYPKTGYTGPYLLTAFFTLTAISKEWLIMTHGTGELLFMIGAIWAVNHYFGKQIGELIQNQREQFLQENHAEPLQKLRESLQVQQDQGLSGIEREKAKPMLYQAKKEQVSLQLEAAYRERLQLVHQAVKNRLDFYAESETVRQRYQQEHIVGWVHDRVLDSITPQLDREIINKCIADLKTLAEKHKATL